MKKIINAPENYVDDMLKGIYAAHSDQVKYAADDLRCYLQSREEARQGSNHHRRRFRTSSTVSRLCRRRNDRWLRSRRRFPVPVTRTDL